MLSIISCACWLAVCLLWRDVYLGWVVCFLLLSCISCLYILEIELVSVTLFANIFS